MTETVLVTGANRGIGLALVERFLAAGRRVFAGCRSPESAPELARLAQASGGALSVHPLNVRSEAQRAGLAAAVGDRLDVLVNNAGVWGQLPGSFGETDTEAWLDAFRVNTIGPMLMMEALVGALAAAPAGRVINMTSRMGSIADNEGGGYYPYRASKAALNAVTKSAAIDLAGHGITVVCAHPGWVRTEMGGPSAPLSTIECAEGLFALVERLGRGDSGRFFNYDGTELPW